MISDYHGGRGVTTENGKSRVYYSNERSQSNNRDPNQVLPTPRSHFSAVQINSIESMILWMSFSGRHIKS